MDVQLPKLRDRLESIPIRHGSDLHIALRDLEGLHPDPLVLTPQAYFLLTLMDGSNSVVDLQAAYMRKFGVLLYQEEIGGLIRRLDSHLLLDNERSRRRRQQLVEEFQARPFRQAFHAGLCYEKDPQRLQAQLRSYFAPENGGPGQPRPERAEGRLLGLMAPHIDLRAGGPCFAHAYKALAEASAVATCVVLGTGHEPLPHNFAATRKHFETPLGQVAVDEDFIEELSRRCPFDIFADEFGHRREHSIEFQTLFLRLLLPGVRIVPLLCCFGVEELKEDCEAIAGMVRALSETLQVCSKPVCLLASVDLAHIGPRYGDQFEPHAGTLRQTEEADRQLLQRMVRADAQGFTRLLIREGNCRRICGLPPLYVMLQLLQERARGELLYYGSTQVDARHSFVTFASMAFYEKTSELPDA